MADPADALGFGDDRLDDYATTKHPAARTLLGKRVMRVLTVLGALIAGYLLAVSINAGRSAALVEDERHAQLVELVREQRERVGEMAATLEELEQQLSITEEQAAAKVPALDDMLRRAEFEAGIAAVTGPGVVVTLFDAPVGCTGARYLCRVQDYDLQLAANTLFAAGAEAVAINNQRIIATTAIRSAGLQITANYRYLAAPYEVRAVGDADALAAAIRRDGLGVALEAAGSGLRLEMRKSEDVNIPGMSAAPAIHVARPVGISP